MLRVIRTLPLAVMLAALSVFALVPAAAQDAAATECAEGTHLFDHELLATDPVCIPDDAQRIVALDTAAAELLLFTDKELAGTFDQFVSNELIGTFPVLAPLFAEVTPIGWPVNLELLLEIQPDLIAAYNNETMIYDQLSAIAPTVIVDRDIAEGNWKGLTKFWSQVFGVEDVYAEMEAVYDARVAELQAALPEGYEEQEVSLVLASSYFNMIYTLENPTGAVIADVGFARPEGQALDSEASTEAYGQSTYAYLSDETLDLADGDLVFVFTFAANGEEAVTASNVYLEEFFASPLWQSLSASQAGTVYPVGYHWTRGNTYLQANAMLDDLFALLTDTEATTPNPLAQFEPVAEE